MLTISYLQNFILNHIEIVYLLIILGVIIEGEIVVIFAGIFAHLNSVNSFYVFIAILLGTSIKSILGYSLGYYLQKNHSKNCFLINPLAHHLPSALADRLKLLYILGLQPYQLAYIYKFHHFFNYQIGTLSNYQIGTSLTVCFS